MEIYKSLYEFVEKVNAGEKSFVIVFDNNDSIHFMSCKHGDAEYFYGCRKYEVSKFRNLDNEYGIVAIVVKEKIYVIDWMAFRIYSDKRRSEQLPENVIDFDVFTAEMNRVLFDVVYPDYYKKFKTTKANAENLIEENMMKAARRKLFTGKDSNYDVKKVTGISKDRTAEMLCDNSNIKDICLEVLEAQNGLIDYIKSRDEFIQNLIDSGKAAQHWEISLADAVNLTEAKTVMVEFEFNGKTAETKIESEKILDALIDNDFFNTYDFPTASGGEKFLKSIGASSYYHSPETNLYPKNIKSISFRGKKVYERS